MDVLRKDDEYLYILVTYFICFQVINIDVVR